MNKQAKQTKVTLLEAQVKSLERALREERLALAAIVKVMLIEVPDPGRVSARLEAMARAAEANPRTPALVRRQLLDAGLFVKTAIQRETGRPQSLFDPDVGHVKPKDVNALVEASEGPEQLGLVTNEEIGDVGEAHDERVRTITKVHSALVDLLREHGALTDQELWVRYSLAGCEPMQSAAAIKERRRELFATGRIRNAGRQGSDPAWDLIESKALEASA